MTHRYLFDTNVFLFMLIDNDLLTREVKSILKDRDRRGLYISSESIKEIIHLLQSGKIRVKHWKSAEDVVDFIKNDTDFDIKYVGEEHLRTLSKLPLLKDHRDPCDRMIITQAITEKITLISSDEQFPRYSKYGLDLIPNKT